MKKRNFITGFSAAFVATMALVSCGGIRAKTGVVLTINGHEYTAEELFNSQKTPAAAEAKFNAVYKVAIRRYFENGQEGFTYMDDITRNTKIKISGAKEEARNNASKNGTKYDVEWKKILTSNGVDDETGLYNKFEYDLQKEKFEDKFYEKAFITSQTEGDYKNNYDILRNGGKFQDYNRKEWGSEINGFFKEKQPYHIKHILVKVGAAENDDLYGEITAAQANKLYNIARAFVEGTLSFEEISDSFGQDDTSAYDNHGTLGIMTRDTGFVNDFKLGIYLYEAAYGSSTEKKDTQTEFKEENAAKKLFGVEDLKSTTKTTEGTAAYYAQKIVNEVLDPTNNTAGGIGQIPYSAFEMLKKAEDPGLVSSIPGCGDIDLTKDDKNGTIDRFKKAGISNTDNVKAKYYPRNVIFNKYFNKHKIMVITPNTSNIITTKTDLLSKKTETSKISRNPEAAEDYTETEFDGTTLTNMPGFKSNGKNDDVVTINKSKNVLRDNHGRTVLVFRSGSSSKSSSNADTGYQGIHFVVIERSPFIGRENDDNTGASKKWTSLNEYYTQYYPEQTDGDHPTYSGKQENKDWKLTYANYYANTKREARVKRSDTVKTELKKADDNLNTYLFDYLCDKGSLVFADNDNGKALKASIDNWINITKRENSAYEKTTKWNKDWKTYYYNLKARNDNRAQPTGKVTKLLPELCVPAFLGDKITSSEEIECTLLDLFGEGGAFYG